MIREAIQYEKSDVAMASRLLYWLIRSSTISCLERVTVMKAVMKTVTCFVLWSSLFIECGAQTPSLRPLELSREFATVRDTIAPKPEEELWKTIPWKTSLLEARQVAAAQGKPIFVWSMDGHPLCLG
jgi:hypothetical protein